MQRNIVVIGAGWSGLAAAVRLSQEGYRVTVLESSPVPGGRARSVTDGTSRVPIDWGQHLFLGCYRETKKLLDILGTRSHLKRVESPVGLYESGGKSGSVGLLSVPLPLRMMGSLLGLSHMGWRARLDLGRVGLAVLESSLSGREELERITAREWLERCGQRDEAIEKFWRPLVVSALNEQPEKASASMLEVVLRRGFFSGGDDSFPELPDIGLGELVALPAVKRINDSGGRVLLKTKAAGLRMDKGRARAATLAGGDEVEGDVFIAAVPAWGLGPLLGGVKTRPCSRLVKDCAAFQASPIVTLFIRTDRKIIDSAYAGILGGSFHWVFDRTGLAHHNGGGPHDYALVCSAAHELMGKPKDELVALAATDLRERFPDRADFQVLSSRVVKDRKATFSPLPCSSFRRPPPDVLLDHGILLAGDWTDTGLPATLEGAVASGFKCADIAADL